MAPHSFTQKLVQRYMNRKSGDYLSSYIVICSPNLSIATNLRPHTQQQKKKNRKVPNHSLKN